MRDFTVIKPPIAKKNPQILEKYGHKRTDPYFWLNNRTDPHVLQYLDAENTHTEAMLEPVKPLREKLYYEIIGRIKQTDESVPYRSNGYWYYNRFAEGMEYPIYCRKKEHLEAPEEILLDVNEIARDLEFCEIGGISISRDNRLMAFSVDSVGRRQYDIRVKDITSGEILEEIKVDTTGHITWANDHKTLFYTVKNETTLRPYRILKHRLGTPSSNDIEIYREDDETFYCDIYKTKSSAYLMIVSASTLSSEYRFLSADTPDGEFKIVQPREREHEYSIEHFKDHFFILTNYKAKNFRFMQTLVSKPSLDNWEEVVGHRPDVFLEGMEIFKDHTVLEERKDGLLHLRVIRRDDGSEHYLDFGEETYAAHISVNREFETELLRYGYSSLTTPSSNYDYNMNSGEKTLLKRQEIVGGFEPAHYQSKRLHATAEDGTKIPISLVYRKDLKKEKGNPLLLYGYGAYGISTDPTFNIARLSLLDRGFIFAIAHIRGGQELGRTWYEEGKLLKKKNTFTDFATCGTHLVQQGYADPEQLFAMGGSAGGLLIGSVINMYPDLFKGVVAAVPFVDALTTMLDDSIPLTTSEYDEWGNPNLQEYYDYILSYSPYDNIKSQNYPHILIVTGFYDSQVQYWEPAKWVAKLRDMKTDNNLLLLYTDMESGHGGASGRFKKFRDTALEYAFFLHLVNIYE